MIASVQCNGKAASSSRGLLCIAGYCRLTIMFAVPVGNILFLDVSYSQMAKIEAQHATLYNSQKNSQQSVPVISLYLKVNEPGLNCTINAEKQRLQSIDLFFANEQAWDHAQEVLGAAKHADPEPATQISQAFDACREQHADVEDLDSEEADEEVAREDGGEQAFHIHEDEDMEQVVGPNTIPRPSEHGEEPAPVYVESQRHLEARKPSLHDGAGDEDLPDIAQVLREQQSNSLKKASAVKEKNATKAASIARQSGKSLAAAPVDTSIKPVDSESDSDITSPEPPPKKRRGRRPPRSSAPQEAPVSTARVLRSNKAARAQAPSKPTPVPKKSTSKKQPSQITKPTAKLSADEEENADIYDVPDDSDDSDKIAMNMKSTFGKHPTKAVPKSKVTNAKGKAKATKKKATAAVPKSSLAALSARLKKTQSAQSAEFEESIMVASTAEDLQQARAVPHAHVSAEMELGNPQNREGHEPSGPRHEDFTEFKAQVMDYDPEPEVATRHDDLEDILPGESASTPASKVKHMAAQQTKAASVPKSSATKPGLVQVPSSSRGSRANKKQPTLVDENTVKKKTMISFGKNGAKNQGRRQEQVTKFSDMLGDEAPSKTDELPSGAAVSSHQKVQPPSSKTCHEVNASAGAQPTKMSSGQRTDTSKKRASQGSASSPRLKRPKISQSQAENDDFMPIEAFEAVPESRMPDLPKRTPLRRQLTHITKEGSPHRMSPEVAESIVAQTPQIDNMAKAIVPNKQTLGSKLWAQLVDPLLGDGPAATAAEVENAASRMATNGPRIAHQPEVIDEHDEDDRQMEDLGNIPSTPPGGLMHDNQDDQVYNIELEDPFTASRKHDSMMPDFENRLRSASARPIPSTQPAASAKPAIPRRETIDLTQDDDDDMDVSSDSSSDVDMEEVKAQDKAREEAWEAALHPRHRILHASLMRVSREFVAHVVDCEKALNAEITDYFVKGREIIHDMDRKHVQQLRNVQAKSTAGKVDQISAKTLSAVRKEHAKMRAEIRDASTKWQKMNQEQAEQLKKLEEMATGVAAML